MSSPAIFARGRSGGHCRAPGARKPRDLYRRAQRRDGDRCSFCIARPPHPRADDVSLTGFGDIPITLDVMPTLSTVHLPLTAMGQRAVRLALEPPSGQARVERVAAQVMLRESTGAPRAAAKRTAPCGED